VSTISQPCHSRMAAALRLATAVLAIAALSACGLGQPSAATPSPLLGQPSPALAASPADEQAGAPTVQEASDRRRVPAVARATCWATIRLRRVQRNLGRAWQRRARLAVPGPTGSRLPPERGPPTGLPR
jgi:hypothetical protein